MLRPFTPSRRAVWTLQAFRFCFFSRATAACALIAVADFSATFYVQSAGAAQLSGVVETGGTSLMLPLGHVKVTLLEATTAKPDVLATATTNADGQFVIDSPKANSSSIFYATADIGDGVEFVTVIGPTLSPEITVNELTSVAASYSMAQFYRTGAISGNSFGLRIAAKMSGNLVTPETAEPSPVLLTSPNADQTNSLRSTRSLANLLAACVGNFTVTSNLFELTKTPTGQVPTTTTQALANLARNPGQNVKLIYDLTKTRDSYYPSLVRRPDAWTLAVKLNDTGNDRFLFAGLGNMVFDSNGYAWITNNVIQGNTTSSRFMVVLQPDGQPSDGANGTPPSPVFGGGILGQGFGITIAPDGSIWAGNFGWGHLNPSPTGNGSVSQFTAKGAPISGPKGYQGGPVRAQGMAPDADGNIWITSYGNDRLYVFLHGDPNDSVYLPFYSGSKPFDVAVGSDGTGWVVNGGGFKGLHPGSVAQVRLVNGQLQPQFIRFIGKALKGMALDSQGNAWITSQGDSTIYGIRPDGTVIGGFNGGGIDGPWGVEVDGEDNLWVQNFGPLQPGSNFTNGRLTKLCGVNSATRPPHTKVGDPISPSTGYTVPSAGGQVLLHNGNPLYGPDGPPSFAPMMRQTSAAIDQAGNIWTLNNWKPDFETDVRSNPGGDGVVIFVGLAPPPMNAH